jgi:aspartate kinase
MAFFDSASREHLLYLQHMCSDSEKTIVMKFGGASLATPAQFDFVADLILKKKELYPRAVIVVSAMGKTTDDLIQLATQVNPSPPQREYDMLLSVGERISMSLLAMAIAKKNARALSFTGSQSGIITTPEHTEAKIIDVRPKRILESLQMNQITIVAGFQGVSKTNEITTLGRGGSDTTAVALAIALKAEKVEFYKDVPGIFSEDPKKNPSATLYTTMSYDHAISLTSTGAKILHNRSLVLAKKNSMPLHVLSFKDEYQGYQGTIIESDTKPLTQPIFEV